MWKTKEKSCKLRLKETREESKDEKMEIPIGQAKALIPALSRQKQADF